MSTWRYKLNKPYSYKSPLLAGIFFANEWGEIEDGIITIFAGYSWDGCSPSFKFGRIWLGTPDGPLNADGRPKSFYASLVHDYLCQFSEKIPVKKSSTIDVFRALLLDGGFSPFMAGIYAKAVDLFGPQNWLGDKNGIVH